MVRMRKCCAICKFLESDSRKEPCSKCVKFSLCEVRDGVEYCEANEFFSYRILCLFKDNTSIRAIVFAVIASLITTLIVMR